MTTLPVKTTIDAESERQVYAYGGSILGEMFVLIIFRCPACGSTGKADSWCEGHSAPPDAFDRFLRVKREPVLVPHADVDRPVTELVERDEGEGGDG